MAKIMDQHCRMIKICDIVKKTMKQLCEFGMRGEIREFHYYSIHNEKRIVHLMDNEKLHNTKHCQRCGTRLIIKDTIDGYAIKCLACDYRVPFNPSPLKNQIKDLEFELYKLLEKANNTKALLETMKRHNSVVEKNLKNKAMETTEATEEKE
jgi:hypothetical protein